MENYPIHPSLSGTLFSFCGHFTSFTIYTYKCHIYFRRKLLAGIECFCFCVLALTLSLMFFILILKFIIWLSIACSEKLYILDIGQVHLVINVTVSVALLQQCCIAEQLHLGYDGAERGNDI